MTCMGYDFGIFKYGNHLILAIQSWSLIFGETRHPLGDKKVRQLIAGLSQRSVFPYHSRVGLNFGINPQSNPQSVA